MSTPWLLPPWQMAVFRQVRDDIHRLLLPYLERQAGNEPLAR